MEYDINPLIWTTRGNLLLDGLDRKDGWDFDDNGISYWEEYWIEGECVKRSTARYQLPEGVNLVMQCKPSQTIEQGAIA